MLRAIITAVIMTVLTASYTTAQASFTFEPQQRQEVIELFFQRCNYQRPNFGGHYNVCSAYAGTNFHLIFLTDVNTGKVTRLPDAELSIELIEGEDTSVIVYNDDVSSYDWMPKLPDRIWRETYTLDDQTGTVRLTSRTKNFHQ